MSGEPSSSSSLMMEQKETKNGISRHAQSSMTIGSKPGGAKKLTIKNFKCKQCAGTITLNKVNFCRQCDDFDGH